LNIKEFIVDANNRLNGNFPSFIPFSSEFLPRNRLIDSRININQSVYPRYFSFYSINKHKEGKKAYIWKLNNLTLQASDDLKIASIKNQVATLIAYIYLYNNPVIKTLHHAVNIMFTEAKLFTIRYCINQATQLANINCIIVITDSLYAAKQIFDSSLHPYQIHLAIIPRKLKKFFIRDQWNFIEFLECLSHDKWILHDIINKEMKKFDLILIFSYKSLWEFNRKNECIKILNH